MRKFQCSVVVSVILSLAGCSASVAATTSGGGGAGGSAGAGGSPGGSGGAAGGGGEGGIVLGGFGGQGGGPIECDPGASDVDNDLDTFTEDEGDCNDCDPNVNPNAIEVVAASDKVPQDEDCDGDTDEPLDGPCDGAIAIDEEDPLTFLQSVELCKLSAGPSDWGVVSSKWVLADGSDVPANYTAFHLGHGVLSGFGPNVFPQKGSQVGALSSGTARQPSDPGYQNVAGFDKQTFGLNLQQPDDDFPKESPLCGGTTTGAVRDVAAIELVMRAPSNAYGFSFDFNFYSYEWPVFVCSSYNDFFVAMLDPVPAAIDPDLFDNISFDAQGNPVSVNNALVDVCGCDGNPPNPCIAGGKQFPCALGNAQLIGTGFGFDLAGSDHAATGWLRTQAPVEPGSEFTIRWATYDSGDGVLDSTTLLDNFQWIAEAGTQIVTQPPPN